MSGQNEVTKIKIRQLKVSDRKRLSAMIEKLVDEVGDNSFLNIISSALPSPKKTSDKVVDKEESQEDDNAIILGIRIVKLLLQTLEKETQEWFIDLIAEPKVKTEAEFLDLPIDAEMQVIDQMVNAQESSSFFTIASRLYSKIEKLQSKLPGAKG